MKMRTIAIEEHFRTPRYEAEIEKLIATQAAPSPFDGWAKEEKAMWAVHGQRLLDLGEGRLADMGTSGIDMQVLQFSGIDFDRMDLATEASVVQEANDVLADAVRAHPDRFAGFAQLNLQDPEGAATELKRCVTKRGLKGAVWSGRCKDRYLDHPSFRPVLEMAEKLAIPIYLHPGRPAPDVFKALYTGLPEGLARNLSLAGWGWHMENALHSLRLVLSGVFDRFPKLQFIIGHMGEGIPFALARANTWMSPIATDLDRSVEEYYLANFHITTSGFFAIQTLLCALMVFGADRIIFSVDYPYSTNAEGRKFLDAAPLSLDDLAKISHKNAEKLLKL
jgi:hypothetical protein